MKYLLLTCLLLTGAAAAFAQQDKNYVLEVNGDTIHLSLDKPEMLKTRSGELIPVKLTKKEVLSFRNAFISFTYPSEFSVTTTKLDEGVTQVLLMTATGNGIMVQCYDEINPLTLVDFMMKSITEDDIAAGYKASNSSTSHTLKNGLVLNGKKSVLTMNKEREEFTVLAHGVRKSGLIIVEIHNDFDTPGSDKIFSVFWDSLQVLLQ